MPCSSSASTPPRSASRSRRSSPTAPRWSSGRSGDARPRVGKRWRVTILSLGGVALVMFGILAVVAFIIACVVVSFFVRRHGESDRPRAGWAPTDERFKDPGTNRTMRVWVDGSGERHYVPEQYG